MSGAPELVHRTAPGVRAAFDAAVPRATAETWLAACGQWFGDARRPLPEYPDKLHLALIEHGGARYVVKRELVRGAARLHLRTGRLARAFELGRELAGAGGPVPAQLGRLDLEGPPRAICTVSPFLDAPTLARVIERGEARPVEPLLASLAAAIRTIHDAGFRHRDMKAPNLLVERSTDRPRIVVLDLEALDRGRGTLAPRIRVRDLGRLAASLRTEAARRAGFEEDATQRLLERYGAPELLPRVLRWTAAKAKRNAARGRPLV